MDFRNDSNAEPNSSGILDLELLNSEDEARLGNARVPIHRVIFEFLDLFAVCFVFLVLLFTFFVRLVTVEGESMNNTLMDKDKLIISNLFYTPVYGDIVVTQVPDAERQPPLIKRVIAVEGQVVDINFDTLEVTVDGEVVPQPYVHFSGSPLPNMGAYSYPHTVSAGKVFVMGDNRNHSRDSRSPDIGEIDTRNIIGKVYFRLLPLGSFGLVPNDTGNLAEVNVQ